MGWWPFAIDSNWKALAREAYNVKDYQKAEPILKKMLKKNPNDKWALDVLSRLYINTSRHSYAIPLCIILISNLSEKKHIRRLIDCCLMRNEFEYLWQYFPAMIIEDEDTVRLERVIKIYNSETWPTEFLELLIATNPTIDRLKHVVIEELLRNGEINEALETIQNLLNLEGLNIELQLLLVKAHIQSQNNDIANKVIARILEKIPESQSQRRDLAKRLYYMEKYESSIQVANIILNEDKKDKQMLDYTSRIHASLGNYEQVLKAITLYSQNYEMTSNLAERMLNSAVIINNSNEIVKAINIYKNFNINNWQLIEKAANILVKNKAFKQLDKLLSISDDNTLFIIQLNASKMSGVGETVKAIEYLSNWMENNGQQIPILMRLAFLNFNIGNIENTIELCDEIITEIKNHSSSNKLRIRAGSKIWGPEKLRQELIEARKLLPDDDFYIRQAINIEMSEAYNFKDALEFCQQGLDLIPGDRRFLSAKAQCLSKLGEHKEAIQATEALFYHHPSDDESFITKAQVMRAKGDGKGQVEAINEMLKLHGLYQFASTGEKNEINIEYLQCDAPKYKKDHGKVSIIMTVYKKTPLLSVAVNSILSQTYQNLELIIVDDNSPDDAFEFLQELAMVDNRIKPLQMEKNGGTYLAKNYGVTQATGDFLAFMDSDDWTHPQRIEKQVENLVKYPNVQGVINDYFRIDEKSNIPYRGKGSIRMACISLLLRKKAQEHIGFFDSLRVGADTEYIERLQAVYGESALIKDRTPNMFMTQHQSSLTGGGAFHISWRSIGGNRLQYHSSFREWHKRISCGNCEGWMPRILRVRPFTGPSAMLSGDTQWRNGDYLFSERIQLRNRQWWDGKKEIEAKSNNVKYHEFFHREENDIYCRLPISFSQAALGAEIEVPLFEKFFKSGTLFICAVISLFFGVLCKEIVVTFPAIAFLAHYFFVSGQSFFKWVRQNFKMICGAALCLILGLIWVLSHDKFLSSSPTSVSWQTYLLTQTFVIPFEYFWKIFFPFNLSIDIDFPLVSDWAKISSFFGVGILSFYLWICFKVQSRLISFGMLWGVIAFFPTSSFVPLLDIAVEHRVYLPLAGFSLAMAGMILAIEQALRKRFSNNDLLGNVGSKASLVCPLIIILCFGVLTTKRNEVWKDEVSLWKDAKEKAPRVVRPYNNLGEAYDKLGNYSPAIDEFKAALSLNPNYVFALSNLGNIYGKLKNYPESVEYFRKAIFIKPDYAPANYNLGKALHAMGKPLEAREYYKKAVDANQYFSEAIFNLAHIESELGFFKDSVKHFQDFIKLRPNLDKAYLALGRAYIGGGESRKAINEFQKALELNPSSLSANINLATAYLESGKVDKSIAIFYGILNRYPKIAGIHKNLGLIFYQHKKDRVKAIHHLKESLSLDNNQPQAAQIRSLILELTQHN